MEMITELSKELKDRGAVLIIFEAFFSFFLFFVAIIGNSCVLLAVYRNAQLRTIPNFFVAALAISDILLPLMCVPQTIATTIVGRWPFSHDACQAQGYFVITLACASFQILTLTALNRFYRIVRTTHYRSTFTKNKTIIMIALCSGLACFEPIPYLLSGRRYVFQPGKVFCVQTKDISFPNFIIFLFLCVPAFIPERFFVFRRRISLSQISFSFCFFVCQHSSRKGFLCSDEGYLFPKFHYLFVSLCASIHPGKVFCVQTKDISFPNFILFLFFCVPTFIPERFFVFRRRISLSQISLSFCFFVCQHSSRKGFLCSDEGYLFPKFHSLFVFLCANIHPGKVFCVQTKDISFPNFIIFLFLCVPAFTLSICYFLIFKKLRSHQQMVQNNLHSSTLSGGITHREIKVTKILFITVIAFLTCWTPLAVIDFVDAFRGELSFPRQLYFMYFILGNLSGPFLFKNFREEYKKMFRICRIRPGRVYNEQEDGT